MEDDIRWPKKGDSPFISRGDTYTSPTWCSLNWLSDFNLDDSYYAHVFKKAADKIIAELERGEDVEQADPMFIPIAFLYRHCLELKMKMVIRKGLALDIINMTDDDINELLGSHNLHKIWNTFKSIVTTYWPDGNTDELKATEKIILDFHKIDKTGQHLRYSKDKNGNKTSTSLPESVELTSLRDTFEGVYNLLDGCETEFVHTLQIRDDLEAHYRNYY